MDDASKSVVEPIDPLRRVFVPVEKRMSSGISVMRTLDGETYHRGTDGVIRSSMSRINGKLARKAKARLRNVLRQSDQARQGKA